MRPALPVLTALALLAAAGPAAHAQTYDLAASRATFSLDPNGVWSYGYSTTASLTSAFVTDTTFVANADGVDFWHPFGPGGSGTDPGYYPYVAQNTGSVATADPTDSWAVDPGQVAMEANNDGRYSLVRFTAPQTGDYLVYAAFAGIHFNLSTTDVHVLDNGASVFDGNIIGYGGDPAFHPVTGASPAVAYTQRLHLNGGDTLTFAVGAGNSTTDPGGVTNTSDTTGLNVTITSANVPEPAPAALALLGVLPLLAARRRRA